jgi:hypothetical protein
MAFLLFAPALPTTELDDISHPTKKPGFDKPGQTNTNLFVIFGGLAVVTTIVIVDP